MGCSVRGRGKLFRSARWCVWRSLHGWDERRKRSCGVGTSSVTDDLDACSPPELGLAHPKHAIELILGDPDDAETGSSKERHLG